MTKKLSNISQTELDENHQKKELLSFLLTNPSIHVYQFNTDTSSFHIYTQLQKNSNILQKVTTYAFKELTNLRLFSHNLDFLKFLEDNHLDGKANILNNQYKLTNQNINFLLENPKLIDFLYKQKVNLRTTNITLHHQSLFDLYKTHPKYFYFLTNTNKKLIYKFDNLQNSIYQIIKDDKTYTKLINKYFSLSTDIDNLQSPFLTKQTTDNSMKYQLNYLYLLKYWSDEYLINNTTKILFKFIKKTCEEKNILFDYSLSKINKKTYNLSISNFKENEIDIIEKLIDFSIKNKDIKQKEIQSLFFNRYALEHSIPQTIQHKKNKI